MSAEPVAAVACVPPYLRQFTVDQDDDFAHSRFYTLVRARYPLSPQQVTCCYHLLRGLTADKEIVRAMGISASTVKRHLLNARRTMDIATREQIAWKLWRQYRRSRAMTRPGGGPCSTG